MVRAAPATFDLAFDRWRDLFRAALVDQWEQNRRRLDYSLYPAGPRHRRPPPQRGRDPAAPAAQRGQRRPQPHRRLQPLPLPRLRGVPARLLVPAPADRRLHPARPAAARRRRLRAAGQVPGDQGVRAPRADLPRGQPVRGQPRPAPAGRGRRAHHPPGAPLPRLRLLLRGRPGQRPLRARARAPLTERCSGLFPLHTVFTRPLQRITSDEEERRRAGFRIVTSYRFQDHGDRPGRLDAIVSDDGRDARRAPGLRRLRGIHRINLGPVRRPEGEADGFWLDPVTGAWLTARQAAQQDGQQGGRRRRRRRHAPARQRTPRHPLRARPPQHPRLPARRPRPDRHRAVSSCTRLSAASRRPSSWRTPSSTASCCRPTRDRATASCSPSPPRAARACSAACRPSGTRSRKAAREALRIAHFDPDTGDDLGGVSSRRPRHPAVRQGLLQLPAQLRQPALPRAARPAPRPRPAARHRRRR